MSRKAAIQALVERWMTKPEAVSGVPLAIPPFGEQEIAEAIDSLLTGWLTMGEKCGQFESMWAEQVGTKHAICVNSGSSALLVLLTALCETGILEPGQEVIVPAVSWSTSLFTVAQAGLKPVLVDVDSESLCLAGEWDRPVMAVHLLGSPSTATGPVIIEDACGAHGARIGGKAVGSIGVGAAFSFFFSHHLSTIEGGMITTDDDALANAARSVRAHGWTRERSDADALAAASPEIDSRFLFVSGGYNLRPTEITGSFGIHQVPRLDGFVAKRRANHNEWCEAIDALGLPLKVFREQPGTLHAAFAFPMLIHADSPVDRPALCAALEGNGIATRPISGSNLARQPAFSRLENARVEGPLVVADAVHERGFFVGQSHGFDHTHLQRLVDALRGAFA